MTERSRMLSRRIATVVLATAAMTLTAGAGTALAGVVTKVGGTITFTATAGEVNDLTVSHPPGTVVFDEPGRAVTAGPGCSPSGDMATCDATGVTRVVMELGDGDDAM